MLAARLCIDLRSRSQSTSALAALHTHKLSQNDHFSSLDAGFDEFIAFYCSLMAITDLMTAPLILVSDNLYSKRAWTSILPAAHL